MLEPDAERGDHIEGQLGALIVRRELADGGAQARRRALADTEAERAVDERYPGHAEPQRGADGRWPSRVVRTSSPICGVPDSGSVVPGWRAWASAIAPSSAVRSNQFRNP